MKTQIGIGALCALSLTLAACSGVDQSAGAEGEAAASTEQALSVGISATASVYTSWADGYCANVTVKNTSTSAITNWSIIIGINPAGISTIWNANGSVVGVPQYRQLVATSQSQNGSLAVGASTVFGFCGLGPASGVPTIVGALGFN
ncbi:MAG: cellulose binding domain-containing protein [Polyangiaceae bacterium]